MTIIPRNQPLLLTNTIRTRTGECTNSKRLSDGISPSDPARWPKRMQLLYRKKVSEELSILREKEKKRREQEWPPEPPKWLKFVGGIGYICIGFRLIGWLQKVDWKKKSREEEEEDEEDEED
ncbi:hypothetical protein D6D18_10523 [Aureobasidium pullulans]|nr:hypothetical protein D6D18_10523 [Aureobasidium pullulans]